LAVRAFVAVLLAIAWAVLPQSASATFRIPEEVEFARIPSPNGRYSFALDPGDRSGAGSSTLSIDVDGARAWSGALPFTFWRAEATDDGLLAGFGYTKGQEVFPSTFEPGASGIARYGEIVAAVIDSRGTVVSERRLERRPVEVAVSIPCTHVRTLRVDAAGRRMMLVIDDEKSDPAHVRLVIVPFDGSAEVVELNPLQVLGDPADPRRYVNDVAAIPGTPLFVVEWRTRGATWREVVRHFALMDARQTVHWQTSVAPVPSSQSSWEGRLLHGPATTLQFTAYMDDTKEEVVFETVEADGRWTAREISRRAAEWTKPPWLAPPLNRVVEPVAVASTPTAPDATPTMLGTIRLQFDAEKESPIRVSKSPRSFAIDEAGGFAFVRHEPQVELVVLSPEGETAHTVSLAELSAANLAVSDRVVHAGGGRFVVAVAKRGEETRTPSHPCVVDVNVGTMRVLEGIDLWGIWGFAAADGLLFCHGWRQSDLNAGKIATMHDLDGKLLWSGTSLDAGGEYATFSPHAAAFLSDGNLALLCQYPNAIHIFDRMGKRTTTWNLGEAQGTGPNFFSDVVQAQDGGVCVMEVRSTPMLVRMTADGKVAEELAPPSRFLVPDFVGSLWYTDEYTFRRLNARMETDKVVGHVPTMNEIGDLAASAIGADGTVYLMARRTNAIHVFAADGAKRHTVRPNVEDMPAQSDSATEYRIVPSTDGGFALTVRNRAAYYDAKGARLGATDFPGESYSPDFAARPDGRCWALEYRAVKLFGQKGELLAETARGHDRQWLTHPRRPLVDAEGALLAFDGGTVHAFDPSGEPRSSFPHPAPKAQYRPCAYGARLLVLSDEDGAILAVHDDGRPAFRFVPAAHPDGREVAWQPFVAAQGKELWLHDGADTIVRYAMPFAGR